MTTPFSGTNGIMMATDSLPRRPGPACVALALVLAACAPAAAPPPAAAAAGAPTAAPAPAAADEAAGARRAAGAALASLAKRNFDVSECAPSDVRVVAEPEARAGAPLGERCSVLTAHLADKTWLVVVRSATRAAPSRAGGGLARVTVLASGDGVTHIDYGL